MNRIWIKLYLEILDDPKMGRLPDHLWRRVIELFLIAGKQGNDGELPPVGEIAWTLRSNEPSVLAELVELSQQGIVHADGDKWFVTNFEKRQYSESYERVKRYRNAKSNAEVTEEVTPSSSSSSSSKSYSYSEEGGGMGEGTKPIPETPKEAKEHPDIQVFQSVSGRFPGKRDYGTIIDTVEYLRGQHGENIEGVLKPYWTAWSTRKTKDGKPYSQSSLVWLCEWAMQGEIPRANGHEPRQGETAVDKQAIIRKVAENAKR